jgi:hypothetical protein
LTSRDNTKWSRRGKIDRELDRAAKEDAIKGLDLRDALEHYGLVFNMKEEALCPFHSEKTPSFRIKGRFWHCFGCNESGELIKFVRKKFGMNYGTALDTICRDFRINLAAPTIKDLERLDLARLERYNAIRRYDELLQDLDAKTCIYWLAYDVLEWAIKHCGGRSIDNERYVSAQFAFIMASRALEQAQFDCAQYVRDNPCALQKPATSRPAPNKGYLPPAPKWGSAALYGDISVEEKR